MRLHLVHAHPVETSYNHALFETARTAALAQGHTVDALNLYDAGFEPVLSREERLNYHDVPDNQTAAIKPYVERIMAADAIGYIFPVWNYGFPAIMKGYFDRVFLPGVAFELAQGGDRGKIRPKLNHVQRVFFITTYGGDHFRTWVMGDPPRRVAMRWGWATFRTRQPPTYLALYDMNNNGPPERLAFLQKVERMVKAL